MLRHGDAHESSFKTGYQSLGGEGGGEAKCSKRGTKNRLRSSVCVSDFVTQGTGLGTTERQQEDLGARQGSQSG